jgi:hypothetical protein
MQDKDTSIEEEKIILLRHKIKLLIEEIGRTKVKGFHGYGATHPFTVPPEKEMLGYVEKPKPKEKSSKSPVKVSRAFSNKDDTSV